MEKICLVVDDICSLPEKLIQEYQIKIVKTKLYFPEWEKFPEKNLYQIMKETKATPKTSAPSPGDFLNVYKKVLENFEKILVITLSSKLSATYSSAREARELIKESSKIFIFDTLTAATSEGLLTLKAANLIREGKGLEEILKILSNLREKVKMFGFLETTYWVEKIGRMSHWQGAAFKILKGLGILPIIGIKKGKVGLVGFNFWTKDVFKAIFHQLKLQRRKFGKMKVGINYTDNIDLAYQLKEKVEKELNSKVDFVSLVPPIVGANSGPGTLITGCLFE